MRRDPNNIMAAFARAMAEGLTDAGALLGLNPSQTSRRHVGDTTVPRTERLAMTALFCGLPEFDLRLADLPVAKQARIDAAARKLREALAEAMAAGEEEPS